MEEANTHSMDEDELWRERTKVQAILTRPWWFPVCFYSVWYLIVCVKQWRLRRELRRSVPVETRVDAADWREEEWW